MGGLLESLYFLTGILILPISQFTLKAKLLSILFRFKGSDLGLFMKSSSQESRNHNMTATIKERTDIV